MIFLDDSGWADFHPFGNPPYRRRTSSGWPSQGCQFHNFYVPQAICSASRSALLSGCYPGRTKVFGAHPPRARGLDPKFATMGQVLKTAGYRTAVFGKWHIGDQPETRPPARGFDESCGLMYSNDMWEFHPGDPQATGASIRCSSGRTARSRSSASPRSTSRCSPPGTPSTPSTSSSGTRTIRSCSTCRTPCRTCRIWASEKFKGKSGTGLYGDVMMEIDWSVGEIMKALHNAGLDDNTLVFFSSDNGPWAVYGNHAGKTPFRESKATGFDGGTRSACIMRYPGQIKAGTISKKALCTVDMLPTLAHLAGAKLPDESDRRPGRVGPHHRQAGREESARLLRVLDGQGLRGRHQRRRALEAAPAAQLQLRGGVRQGRRAGQVRHAKRSRWRCSTWKRIPTKPPMCWRSIRRSRGA